MDGLLNYQKNAWMSGLCQEYKQKWQKCHNDKERLMRLALCQQSIPHLVSFAVQGKGLTKEYLLEEFGKYLNGKRTFDDVEGVKGYTYQMYAGYDKSIDITSDVTNLMWCKSDHVVIDLCKCPVLYVSNHSDVTLVCNGYNHVILYLFDDSKVTIDDTDEHSKITVYKYSPDATVEEGKYCLGGVKVFDKELRL